jgi:hypothetical protein
MVEGGVQSLLNLSKGISKHSGWIIGVLGVGYLTWVFPLVLDFGPSHKEISTFARKVADDLPNGQQILIQIEKSPYKEKQTKKTYNNIHTIRYYLIRAGVPYKSFIWKDREKTASTWLIAIHQASVPSSLSGQKNGSWDLVIGPYTLKKHWNGMNDKPEPGRM